MNKLSPSWNESFAVDVTLVMLADSTVEMTQMNINVNENLKMHIFAKNKLNYLLMPKLIQNWIGLDYTLFLAYVEKDHEKKILY